MDKFIRYTLILVLLFFPLSAWGMVNESYLETNSPLIGKVASDVVLTKTDGTAGNVIGSRQGKKAILVFWATWCPHCYEDLGTINDNFASVEKKGTKIILVDVGEAKEDVKRYLSNRQMKLVSFVDENSFLEEAYHLIGIPTLIFIDENGIIRSVTHAFPSDYAHYFGVK